MTGKERLEEIKDRYMELEYDFNLRKEDIDWLIERIEELEEILLQTNYDAALLEKRTEELLKLNEQNKRYREAMKTALKVSEYYNAFGGDLEKVRADIHNILDKALEGEE